MGARGLRGAVVILIVSTGFGVAGGSAHAEGGAAAQVDAGGAAGREPTPDAPGAASRRDAAQLTDGQEAWWAHAREVLFKDLELRPEQARGVDEIIQAQLRARKRAEELRAELAEARKQGDQERLASLRPQLRAQRKELKSPHAPIEEMRKLLSEAQRPSFDMNRARLVAEGQRARQAQRGSPARGRAAGVAVDAQ